MASATPAGRIRWSYTPSPSPSAPNLLPWQNWWQRWCRWLPRADPMEAMAVVFLTSGSSGPLPPLRPPPTPKLLPRWRQWHRGSHGRIRHRRQWWHFQQADLAALHPLPFLRPQDSPVMAAVASMLLRADPMDVAAGGGISDERFREERIDLDLFLSAPLS
ncbi:hypothetical protein DAI22_11g103700 [Oryza sativa Japonica Group]|nr:hypothetical protein DAI22_11g103700 [Oryza sativa Japonica Group]